MTRLVRAAVRGNNHLLALLKDLDTSLPNWRAPGDPLTGGRFSRVLSFSTCSSLNKPAGASIQSSKLTRGGVAGNYTLCLFKYQGWLTQLQETDTLVSVNFHSDTRKIEHPKLFTYGTQSMDYPVPGRYRIGDGVPFSPIPLIL